MAQRQIGVASTFLVGSKPGRLWRSRAFRRCAWWVARGGGAVRRGLARGWYATVVVAVGLTLYLTPVWWLSPAVWKEHLNPTTDVYRGAVLALVIILLARNRMRQRYLVNNFQHHLGGSSRVSGSALAGLLRHELASITAVFRTIDEASPGQTHRAVKLELAVEDIGEDLEQTIGEDVTIGAGFFKVSVSKLWKALRLFRGPTINGNLHREGCGLVLTVELTGGGKRGSWRVGEADLAEERRARPPGPTAGGGDGAMPPTCDLEDEAIAFALVRQAAYRVAAQIASLGSPRWEAVRAFTDGLRAYRKVSRSDLDRDIELRRAERCFLDALRADRGLAWGHFNLGVVYSQLGELDAALAAFRQSIATNPDNFAPYLGLGTAYFDKGVATLDLGHDQRGARECFLQAAVYAAKAIAISPTEPRPWNGLAAARTLFHWAADKPRRPEAIPEQEFVALVDTYRTSAALAWRRLCRSELMGEASHPVEEARGITVLCLENLAEVFYEQRTANRRQKELQSCMALLREALRLAPRRPSLHLALGKALASCAEAPKSGRLMQARSELYETFGDGLDEVSGAARWAWLLAIDAHRYQELRSKPAELPWLRQQQKEALEGMRRAFAITLDLLVPPESLVLRRHSREPEDLDASSDPELARYRTYLRRVAREVQELFCLPWLLPEHEAHSRVLALEAAIAALVEIEHLTTPASESLGESDEAARRKHALPRELGPWIRAQTLIREARLKHIERSEQAIPLLYRAIRSLALRHARQIKRQGLDALMARAYLGLGNRLAEVKARRGGRNGWGGRLAPALPAHRGECLQRALDHAFRAVALEPESAPRRLVLSQVHCTLGDYAQAEVQRKSALGLGPAFGLLREHEVTQEVASRWLALLALAQGDQDRAAVEDQAARELQHLCEMLEASPLPPVFPNASRPRPLFFAEHAEIHLALGRLLLTPRPQQAIDHLWIAHQSDPNNPEPTKLLKRALADPAVLRPVYKMLEPSGARELPGWARLIPRAETSLSSATPLPAPPAVT